MDSKKRPCDQKTELFAVVVVTDTHPIVQRIWSAKRRVICSECIECGDQVASVMVRETRMVTCCVKYDSFVLRKRRDALISEVG